MPPQPKAIGPVNGLAADLARRLEAKGRPIRIGLIGSGEMGTDILSQVAHMQGITVAAVADTRQGRVTKASEMATGEAGHVKNCDSAASSSADTTCPLIEARSSKVLSSSSFPITLRNVVCASWVMANSKLDEP